MSEIKEGILWGWAIAASVWAVYCWARWVLAEEFYKRMRDGWRAENAAHRETLLRVDGLATARAERMTAEAALVDALQQGAKPEAKA